MHSLHTNDCLYQQGHIYGYISYVQSGMGCNKFLKKRYNTYQWTGGWTTQQFLREPCLLFVARFLSINYNLCGLAPTHRATLIGF